MAEEIKTPETEESGKNFIINFIDEDIAEGGQFQGMTVHTRFPPEPNGYLHIGHCKALTIDFGTAERYNGLCNLRMDDTNPTKEDEEFVEAIKQDIHWLGFDWGDRFFYGSDYFEKDYEFAVELIKKGLAYVDDQTQDEIREVVAYAAARGITVVPEIDLPGHMLAALACYPELGCTGGPYEVETGWGVFEDVLCPGKEKTFEFLENVLTEVMELFPSEYIHIGGDECPKTRWEKCPACQARIKALGLKDDDRHSAEHYLQSYVTARIEKFLNEHGRRIIGWDEILEGELAPNATVMSWRGTEGGIYAAKMGHDAIMTPTTYCYLDYCQASDPENEPLNIGGYVPVEKLYSYEPVPDSLVNDYGKYIIGVQANLWTEYIPTNEQLEYMLLPRVAALSEVQWCDRGTREWTRFAQALPHMLQIYDRMGLNYATTVFGVTGLTEKNEETGAEEIVLSTIDQTPIHYTLDGSEPTAESPVYTDPIALDKEYTVKAAVFREEIPTRTFSKTFAPTAEKEE